MTRDPHQIKWCDGERDGHGVYAQYRVEFFKITTGGDPDGSGPHCGTRRAEWPIYDYRVCESSPKATTCSRWKRT
ncbi:hypothetical protein ETD83_22545 [Actinomadura soli]|uniref:Uncharacterized protein n=1 Tax=Actinomadura soli TaxID=2508997 RepID=A0A5C4J8T0_9ACTN|nr:hypothetical protein [Actinomadura soli]TMQ95310.1 hypothetical protein ETD83_22545 [Actinomadura soli]